ncbi:MAG: hypothetical protein JO112_01520, partial [Planctomycetes bacterium]|nr:hypothetical protein [Planctomycetota bacterium]
MVASPSCHPQVSPGRRLGWGLAMTLALCMPAAAKEPDPQALAEQARKVLTTYCYRCHGRDGTVEGGMNYLMDRNRLVARHKVLPGQPQKSLLLRRVVEDEMPPEGEKPRPSPEDVALLRRWIEAGAPDFNPVVSSKPFISPADVAQAIRADLEKRSPREARFTRYFTLTHLRNAGLSEDELQTYRNGVSKLLNSLSWGRQVVVPVPVDPAKTVLRIDLRDYHWTESEWAALAADYPYALPDTTAAGAFDQKATGCDRPQLRGDWFVASAARPPLYHRLLQLPTTEEELTTQLRVDVAADIASDRVARAGFNNSGVSRNNRLIERHESPFGAYWRTYDFATSAGEQNLFERPLGPGTGDHDFRPSGGEIIFNLPNGLQGYLIVNAQAKRLDKAPTTIVTDPRSPDRAVEDGLSCMACHLRGINPKRDQVRRDVLANRAAFDAEEVEDVQALYPPAETMDKLMEQDAGRFLQACAAAGAPVGTTEPITALAAQFDRELDLPRAAAETGLTSEKFLDVLKRSPRLSRTLGPLAVGETVERDLFAGAFADLTSELEEGKSSPLTVGPTPGPANSIIPAPTFKDRVEVKLAEPFAQVRTGGGGRYLIFHLKVAKKLAIFDVTQAKVVREIDVPADDILYAAGLD